MRHLKAIPLAAALLLAAVGCEDATAPSAEPPALGLLASEVAPLPAINVLRQAPDAPRLESYRVSFWARRHRASTVIVNYQPVAGQSVGAPFLRFDIPEDGLRLPRNDRRLRDGLDSIRITLTIDPATFTVTFEPSGLEFSRRHPATLAIWYGNADPDLNGDGAVDGTDEALATQLAFWVRETARAPWLKLSSATEADQWIVTAVHHFSDYAVSW